MAARSVAFAVGKGASGTVFSQLASYSIDRCDHCTRKYMDNIFPTDSECKRRESRQVDLRAWLLAANLLLHSGTLNLYDFLLFKVDSCHQNESCHTGFDSAADVLQPVTLFVGTSPLAASCLSARLPLRAVSKAMPPHQLHSSGKTLIQYKCLAS